MKIYRDAEGKCINIGEWDYQVETFTGTNIAKNPLPDGAYEDEAEVIVGWDGGRYLHDDPRAVKS